MDSSRFDRLSRSLAGATTRRAALLALLGGLLPFVVSAAGTGATGRRSNHRGHRGRGPDARSDRARGRDQRGGAQAEKKKPKKKKKASPCPRAKSRCGALCVDTASDASNCGSCGAACAAGQTCRGGTCTCNGERCTGCCDGMTCLPGASEAQCGSGGVACLACSGGRTCENGSCACPPGHDVCADTCVDRQTNLSHCGECGRGCAQSETCRGGVCGVDCGTGFCAATGTSPDCCGGACRNLSTDVTAMKIRPPTAAWRGIADVATAAPAPGTRPAAPARAGIWAATWPTAEPAGGSAASPTRRRSAPPVIAASPARPALPTATRWRPTVARSTPGPTRSTAGRAVPPAG
jgi:hypothetical protein